MFVMEQQLFNDILSWNGDYSMIFILLGGHKYTAKFDIEKSILKVSLKKNKNFKLGVIGPVKEHLNDK